MCESNAYLVREGREELVMESVDVVRIEGDTIVLKSIFGEQASFSARLTELNLAAHRIVFESP